MPASLATLPLRPRVLIAGEAVAPEFHDALRLLKSQAYVQPFQGASIAHVSWDCDIALLCCPWPVSNTLLAEQFREATPRAKHVQLLGVWCEGEGRTGKVIEGYERLFWHAFAGWRQKEYLRPSMAPYRCLIEARDEETRSALATSLAWHGAASPWDARASEIGVWVGSQLSGAESDRLWNFCKRMRRQGAPVVALLDFPRPETVAAAKQIGAACVFGKPIDASILGAVLGQLAYRSTTHTIHVRAAA